MATAVERLGRLTNAVHGFIYFAPQVAERFEALGLTGRQQYFAGRAAPMGPVGAGVVVATFFNFNPSVVHAAIPAAWDVAAPESVQGARLEAAAQVLGDACAHIYPSAVTRATEIAAAMVDGVGDEGKPLAAANRQVRLPEDPLTRLWQLVTVIREWRGDAHVAALCAAPVTGPEALVLHAATDYVPAEVLRSTRAWSREQWQHAVESLRDRGMVDDSGRFTDAGRAFREAIEEATNRASQPLVDAVGPELTHELCDLLKPISTALVESGAFARPLRGVSDDPNGPD